MSEFKIFISHSHTDSAHLEQVRHLIETLQSDPSLNSAAERYFKDVPERVYLFDTNRIFAGMNSYVHGDNYFASRMDQLTACRRLLNAIDCQIEREFTTELDAKISACDSMLFLVSCAWNSAHVQSINRTNKCAVIDEITLAKSFTSQATHFIKNTVYALNKCKDALFNLSRTGRALRKHYEVKDTNVFLVKGEKNTSDFLVRIDSFLHPTNKTKTQSLLSSITAHCDSHDFITNRKKEYIGFVSFYPIGGMANSVDQLPADSENVDCTYSMVSARDIFFGFSREWPKEKEADVIELLQSDQCSLNEEIMSKFQESGLRFSYKKARDAFFGCTDEQDIVLQ